MTEPQTIPADMVRQLIQPHLDSDVSTPALWDLVKSLESLLPSPPTPLAEIKFGGKAMWGEKEVLIVAESPNNGGRLPIYWREEDKMTGSDQAWVNPSELLQHPDDAATVDRTGWEGKNGPFPDPVGPYADRFSPDIQEVVESWLQKDDPGNPDFVKTTLDAISEAAALLNDEPDTGSHKAPAPHGVFLIHYEGAQHLAVRNSPNDDMPWETIALYGSGYGTRLTDDEAIKLERTRLVSEAWSNDSTLGTCPTF